MSLYTEEIRRIHKSIKCKYPGLIWDIIEYDGYLTMCLYRNNFGRLAPVIQEYVANEFIPTVMQKTWDADTPIYLEVRNESG